MDQEHLENIPEREYNDNSEHPGVEELFIREAAKHLTAKQRAIWEYHNFDRLTQDEIADRVGIKQSTVNAHIRACEERIKRWCDDNRGVYNVIQEQLKRDEI
jgi:RNA polymerase sigma factor (sigma-70 family)